MIQLLPDLKIESRDIRFNKNEFLIFNNNDHLGLFNDRIKRVSECLGRIDPGATSLFDYDEYIKKLMIRLFTKYEYLELNEKESLLGVKGDQKFLIKPHLKGWYKEALLFVNKKEDREK
jgi:hypothetical protein